MTRPHTTQIQLDGREAALAADNRAAADTIKSGTLPADYMALVDAFDAILA